MAFPTISSAALQNSLNPNVGNKAPTVSAVNAAIALLAPLVSPAFTGTPTAPTAAPGTNTTQVATTAFVLANGGGGGGGVSAHGALTGLGNDDHTQYQNNARGDARYALVGHVGAGGTAHANAVASGAAGFLTGADKAKIDSVATGATANSSDATLLNRANHTGTQTASTISDFAEAVDDRVAALLVQGANITMNYNDAANTLTISAAGAGGGATLADGDYGDITASGTGTVLTIDAGVVTYAKMQNIATDSLIGRDTAGSGPPESITVGGGIEFDGANALRLAAFTGDVTKATGATALVIPAATVTLAQMANLATDRLVGRDTAGTGVPESLTVSGGIEFTGAGGLQVAAFTGDVTKSAGSTVTTISNAVVTLAKLNNLAQDQFIGRVTASTGVPETATITAAARTVLDDTTVDAMLNTLGGATAQGTGAVVRAVSPTLTTPTLGVAAATSLALGGGTALTTTNRTGTGNLVLATAPTITTPTLNGIVVSDGSEVTTANAMGALAIDVTKSLNTKSVGVNSEFTFSGTPASSNTWFGMLVTNTDTAPHILTLPSSFDMGRQATITTCPIAASGRLWLAWHYNGSTYNLFGASGFLNKYDGTSAPLVTDDVSKGYGPGSLWLNATSNIAYICESNGAGAAVWNALGGGVSDANYGEITVSGGVWSINAAAVTLAKLANITTDSLIGRDTTGTGVPEVITVGGGIEFTGTSALRTSALTGDVTKAAGGTVMTIANSAVSLAKMADLVTARFIGRVTGTTGAPEAITAAQATSLLDTFTAGLKGLVPLSGGGTANFLRSDGAWAAPAGGGTVTNTGNLTNNAVVLGNGTTDTKVVAGITTDGTSILQLGVAGSTVGGIDFRNATSGTISIRPPAGALGTVTLTAPAVTGTLATLAVAETLTNKTINGANNTLTVRLANDVTGNLPVANLNSGTAATASTFWRGDGAWATPSGGGDVSSNTGTSVDSEIALFNSTTGKSIKRATGTGFAILASGVLSVVDGANDDFSQRKSGVWTNRTVAQVQADLQGTGLGSTEAGFRIVPINSQSAAYTAVAADSAKAILHPVGDNNARTFTIPSNASVAYPVGTAITFVNKINTVTIAINSDTLTLMGPGTTGSRTLAANGIATAVKITTTEWVISGTGLT